MLKRTDDMNHKAIMEALGSIPGMGSLTGVPATAAAGKVDPKSLRIDETNANVSRITGIQLDESKKDPDWSDLSKDEIEAMLDKSEIKAKIKSGEIDGSMWDDEGLEECSCDGEVEEDALASTDDDAPAPIVSEEDATLSHDVSDFWADMEDRFAKFLKRTDLDWSDELKEFVTQLKYAMGLLRNGDPAVAARLARASQLIKGML